MGSEMCIRDSSYNDLPDTFGIVYFGVIPYDRDEGRFDTIVFHLDYNVVPVITYIETPQVEKSGAFEIRFVPFDQERDSLSFKFEYSVSDTMSWRGAPVSEVESIS